MQYPCSLVYKTVQTCSQDPIDNGNYDQTNSITNNFNAFEILQVMVKISENNFKIHLPYRYTYNVLKGLPC